jgi:hypothetical protein
MDIGQIRVLWDEMAQSLDERQRRAYAATLAEAYGYGGAKVVHEVCGIAPNTITAGKKDLAGDQHQDMDGRVRREGGGRWAVEEHYPEIRDHISGIVDASTYGDPGRVLSWTTESLRKIADGLLKRHGIKVSHVTVGSLLFGMGYSKQSNQKMLQAGDAHPDRDAQFRHIDKTARAFIDAGDPVISVDTKKKELIGNFKNNGREYRQKGDACKVLDHDFPIHTLGRVSPCGIYNLNDNTDFVNLGSSNGTAEFAIESISRWWDCVGKASFPDARRLMVTCDCGGSNGNRLRLYKYQLAQLSARTGLDVYVSHFPSGTSKWNKVEHRLFCFISKNWQGKPLTEIQTAVSLIGSTATKADLKVICVQDDKVYELAQKVSDEDFEAIPLSRLEPFGQWNYVIGERYKSQVIFN